MLIEGIFDREDTSRLSCLVHASKPTTVSKGTKRSTRSFSAVSLGSRRNNLEPYPKTKTHFSAPSKENELSETVEVVTCPDSASKRKVYERAILPELDHHESFLDSDRQKQFKHFLKAQLSGMEKKYLGFPSTSFRDRSYKSELDAA